jgi:hypothetical protein
VLAPWLSRGSSKITRRPVSHLQHHEHAKDLVVAVPALHRVELPERLLQALIKSPQVSGRSAGLRHHAIIDSREPDPVLRTLRVG